MAGTILSKLNKFFKGDGGNVAVTTAIVLVPMLTAAGAAVDYSRLIDKRTKLQNVVDSAALAGGLLVRTASMPAVKREVRDFIEANMPEGIEPTSIRIEPDAITGNLMLEVRATEPTTLMAVAGIDDMPYKVSAGINLGALHLNVAIVLDNSGSMNQEGKLVAAKAAANTFVENTYDNLNPQSSMRVSIVGFNQHVNVGVNNAGADWLTANSQDSDWKGCVSSRLGDANVTDTGYDTKPIPAVKASDYSGGGYWCPNPALPLIDDREAIVDYVNTLSADGLTYIANGIMLGVRMLTPNEPFTEANIDLSGPARNILIVMTDGDNTVARRDSAPRHDLYSRDVANQHTTQSCTLAKNFQMDVYTISFGSGVTEPTKALLQGCASVPDNYFDANNNASLVEAFESISDEVSGLVLSN